MTHLYIITNISDNDMRVDMHVHSRYSCDCGMDLKMIAKYAMKRMLDGVAITDHGCMKAFQKSVRIFNEYNIESISGVEIRVDMCDFLVYFIDDESLLKMDDIHEIIDFVHDNSGIIAIAHPYREGYVLPSKEIIAIIDAIEEHNSRDSAVANKLAERLRKKYKKCIVSGSDAHTYGYIGLSILITEGEDIRECILKNNVRVASKSPDTITRFVDKITTIRYMPLQKKMYYISHPEMSLKKLLRK